MCVCLFANLKHQMILSQKRFNLLSVHKTFNICWRTVTRLKRNNMSITEEDKSEGKKGDGCQSICLIDKYSLTSTKLETKNPPQNYNFISNLAVTPSSLSFI